jgi:hypothetical protein
MLSKLPLIINHRTPSRNQQDELRLILRGSRIPERPTYIPMSDCCQLCNNQPDEITQWFEGDRLFDGEGRRRMDLLLCACGTTFCTSCVLEQLNDVSSLEFYFDWRSTIYDSTQPGWPAVGKGSYRGSFVYEVAWWFSGSVHPLQCLSCCVTTLESAPRRCDIIYGKGRPGWGGGSWRKSGKRRKDPVLGPSYGKHGRKTENDFDRLLDIWVDRLEQQRGTDG